MPDQPEPPRKWHHCWSPTIQIPEVAPNGKFDGATMAPEDIERLVTYAKNTFGCLGWELHVSKATTSLSHYVVAVRSDGERFMFRISDHPQSKMPGRQRLATICSRKTGARLVKVIVKRFGRKAKKRKK